MRQFVIDGRLTGAAAGETMPVENPSTGALYTTVPLGRPADAEAAIVAARRAFDTGPWPRLSPAERAAVIQRLGELMEANRQEFIDIGVYEVGTARAQSVGVHHGRPMDAFYDLLEKGSRSLDVTLPRIDGPVPTEQMVTREPRGVVSVITPWNCPQLANLWKVTPALLTGNTVIVKPSPEAPSAALALGRLGVEAGLPPGVLNVITGGPDVGELMASHPYVDMVSFTGSAAVGRLIAAAGAPTLKRLALELGGKSALLVLPDADPASVAARALRATYGAGQICALESRLLLPDFLHDDIVGRIVAAMGEVRVGPADAETTTMGPLITDAHLRRVEGWIESGRASGAKVATGGNRPTGLPSGGHYLEPTLLVEVTNDMPVAREEIFGPVLVVIRYSGDIDEGVAIVNDSQYGLVGSVHGGDAGVALAAAKRIRSGRVLVNNSASTSDGPFGGFKQSGIGREVGQWGLEEFTEVRYLAWPA
jgi:aldehyde dehydrogenase (NAD+)